MLMEEKAGRPKRPDTSLLPSPPNLKPSYKNNTAVQS